MFHYIYLRSYDVTKQLLFRLSNIAISPINSNLLLQFFTCDDFN
ncbi:hypothetical protein HMPREF9012_1377 [Bacteroidetes bacterium oral taxon 272 str. F0290]|nr:hypothetical protein HMPREF9012_1377 [Bacteroidetes bacterium oral taxon 272 str. F0290]